MKKSRLLEFITLAYEQEKAFVDMPLTAQDSNSVSLQGWSKKEIAIHLAVVKERMNLMLGAVTKGEKAPRYLNINAENQVTVEQFRRLSWDQVRNKLQCAQTELMDRVQVFSEGDLNTLQPFDTPNGKPLWGELVMNGFWHPMLHLAQYYYERGEPDRLTAIVENTGEQLCQLDESPTWQGRMLYDVACYLALTGHQAQANAKLGAAFKLDPGLKAWSKLDTDLASIRDTPAYNALIA